MDVPLVGKFPSIYKYVYALADLRNMDQNIYKTSTYNNFNKSLRVSIRHSNTSKDLAELTKTEFVLQFQPRHYKLFIPMCLCVSPVEF